MNESTTEDLALGPVDIVVIGYPADAPQTGSAIPVFIDLVDRGIIRVLDVRGVRREPDGTFSAFDIDNVAAAGAMPDLVAFEGAQTGLIGDDDLRVAVEAMEPGSGAILICFENSWAAPFVREVRRNGGHMLAFERVTAEDLIEAVDRLEAADASA